MPCIQVSRLFLSVRLPRIPPSTHTIRRLVTESSSGPIALSYPTCAMPRVSKKTAAAAAESGAAGDVPPATASASASAAAPSSDSGGGATTAALLATVTELRSTLTSLQASQTASHDALAGNVKRAAEGKLAAQAALIVTLREEVARLTGRLTNEGPVPAAAVKASATYRSLEAAAAAAQAAAGAATARADALAARTAQLQDALAARPPPSAIAAYHALTGVTMRLRQEGAAAAAASPSSSSMTTTAVGLFDCVTLDPETQQGGWMVG